MPLQQDTQTPCVIKSYQPGLITLLDRNATHSIIIDKNQQVRDWPVATLQNLTNDHFATITAQKPRILLLGTGEQFQLPNAATLAPLHHAGIGVECMDTAAACR